MSWLQQMRQQWRPEHLAVACPEGELTYAQLDERVGQAATWLIEMGLKPGDVVALQLPKHPVFLQLHLAAMAIGVITLPLNPAYTPKELAFYLEDSGARMVVVSPHSALSPPPGVRLVRADESLYATLGGQTRHPLPEHWPSDTPAIILYTSGTTGRPKGAVLSHQNLQATVDALREAWRWERADILVHALPLFHVHGLFVAQHAALATGATSHWLTKFDAEAALDLMVEVQGTIFMGVPTFYSRILALPSHLSWPLDGVRLFTSGSAPLPARDHIRFEERFGHRILERYGMTEVGIVLSNPYEGERRPGTVGSPVPGATVRIFDVVNGRTCAVDEVGEVQISGPSVFGGYLGLPDKTAEALVDGWMRSGDLGAIDADGYIRIVGRRKDMLLSGGLNVYPSEVEAVLLEHPSVSRAAVVGAPDPDLGERVVATVVLQRGQNATPDELIAWCRRSLAPYKCPKAVERVDALPVNAMGKVQKAVLRARWGAVRVRRATIDDLDGIVDRNRALALETEQLDLSETLVRRGVAKALGGEVGAWYLVAEVAHRTVAQCMVTSEWSDWRNQPIWWIQSVFVDPQWRRRGVFKTLFNHVQDQARQAGAGGLRLYVDRSNSEAQSTYSALGMDDQHYALFERLFDR